MTTLTLNQSLNGIELKFEGKPVMGILSELKENGFRWHPKKKIWYAKQTPERLELAQEIADGQGIKVESKETSVKPDKQKELKEKYMDIIRKEVWIGSEHMQEYARKNCEYVVELSNGNLIEIEKPRIKTDFCFGMGMFGTYSDEEFERAENAAENARTNEEYFISENLKQVTESIEMLNLCLARKLECYTYTAYSGQPETSRLKTYSVVYIADNPEYEPGRWSNLKDVQKLENGDIQRIIDGLEVVKERFTKRLHTYLKRYGLSKLNVWTYCRD